jgi:hypothetical protein
MGQVLEEERVPLRPFTAAFDGYVEHTLRVCSTCLVNYDRNRYRVPAAYPEVSKGGKPVSLRAPPFVTSGQASIPQDARIPIAAAEQILADPPRCFGRGPSLFNPWHDLPVLERKPGALRDGAPFQP